jgi:serine/threonine-protein kinase
LLAVLLFFLGNDILMPWYVSHGAHVAVPSVIGLPFERAKARLDSLGFEPRQGDIRTSEEYPAGTVIIQNPLPGARVKGGRRIYLTISGGEQLVTVPQLRGKTLRDARFALERNGLKLGEVTYAANEELPPNTIIDQGISGGLKGRRGLLVAVLVSQGSATGQVEVPDVIGRTMTEAGRILANSGLRIGNVSYEVSATLLPNTVVDQYPRGGSLLAYGEAVDVFVVGQGGKKQPPIEN